MLLFSFCPDTKSNNKVGTCFKASTSDKKHKKMLNELAKSYIFMSYAVEQVFSSSIFFIFLFYPSIKSLKELITIFVGDCNYF
jgi:hypothetical protein